MLMAASGETCDRDRFLSYIKRNLEWYYFKNGHELTIDAAASYTRDELAHALRRGPYMVNLLVAGFDQASGEARMYWMDYLGTLQQTTKGAHGYAAYFVSSTLDNHFKLGMTFEEGKEAIRQCIRELQKRFLISQKNFKVKAVTKDGVVDVTL